MYSQNFEDDGKPGVVEITLSTLTGLYTHSPDLKNIIKAGQREKCAVRYFRADHQFNTGSGLPAWESLNADQALEPPPVDLPIGVAS